MDITVEKVSPITADMNSLIADPLSIDQVLADGSQRAREISEPIMRKVKEIAGFIVS